MPDVVEPTVGDIASLLRARTQDDNDVEIGTFNDETRPTGSEVERMIQIAGDLIFGAVGNPDDLTCPDAQKVVESIQSFWILLTAMVVELSYFPEQVKDNRSPYDQFKELYDTLLPHLTAAVVACQTGGSVPPVTPPGEDGVAPPADSSWDFMRDAGGLVGWGTRW